MRLGWGAQRACAIALALTALTIAYFGLIHWWLVAPLQRISEEEQVLRDLYTRYSALEAQRSAIQTRLEETRQRPLPKGSLLNASGPEAATAQLMQLISSRIFSKPERGLGCSIKSRLPQPVEAAGQVLKIRVDVELECGIESLTKTLYRMETEPPFLKVNALSIHRDSSAVGAQSRLNHLAVKLQIGAYLSKPEVTAP
ncbi:proteinral secretion pathway protein GspM [Pseudomonas syringae pv. philadelphi]|uniref:Proteinral secretion pathway protein GspM n=1 Tax=Pseudomonas syringae pv. philadelphi TaxID=251706 RepID=A0A3M3ZU60_9PSED|nr:type II secretion system protein GspM [Pseudomonas syringae group genomosp. 3]RMO98141.1 proteinral secretion pathway protein GspM [Pseudomonas syringae pv. philadelphi]